MASNTKFHAAVALLLPACLLMSAAAATPGGDPVGADDTSRALRGAWKELARHIESQGSISPIEQFLLGHAYLALNRNNESICLLLHAEADTGRAAWLEWTATLASRHPGAAVAHYIHGDALARFERWDEALTRFDRALDVDASHALSMNARAAALAAQGHWDAATVVLDELIGIAPGFADAYSSRGAIYVKRSQAPRGAVGWFDRALDIVPDFSLALNGRGSARMAMGDWDGAQVDLGRAAQSSACTLVTTGNLLTLEFLRAEEMERRMEWMARSAPGTSTSRSIRLPADRHLPGLRSAHTNAMWSGALAKMMDGARDYSPRPPLKSVMRIASESLRAVQQNHLDRARSSFDAVHNDNYNAVRTNLRLYPNGAAAQEWKARGVQNYHQLTPSTFDNPPPRIDAGGVDTSMRHGHVDTGRWPVSTWFGLGYEVHPETSADDSVETPPSTEVK